MSNDLSSSTSSLLEWTVWRPLIPISNDGKPLATNITDLFFDFPYDRLPQPQGSSSSSTSSTTAATTTALLNLLLRPEISFTLCLMYYVSKPILKTWIGPSNSSSSSSVFTSAVAFHNFVLALFSAVCCWNSWPIVVQYWYRHGWEAVYCDQTGALWNDSGLGGWIIIFYWSKYYEFVDTWVLICKGKEPSFLQVYHHIGIVLFMWGGVVSKSAWLLIVLLLNSGIHTLMYTYFFVKTLYPKLHIKNAKYLTQLQIIQFFVGILYTVPLHYFGDACDTQASRFAVTCIQLYAIGLILLFVAFATKKYKKE